MPIAAVNTIENIISNKPFELITVTGILSPFVFR